MYLRGTGHVSGDLPHIVLTGLIVLFILSAIAVGTSLYGRRWRLYSWATLLVLLISGAWTGFEAGRLAAGQPAPWLGVAERINIGVYLMWVGVLATILLRGHPEGRKHGVGSRARVDHGAVHLPGQRLIVVQLQEAGPALIQAASCLRTSLWRFGNAGTRSTQQLCRARRS